MKNKPCSHIIQRCQERRIAVNILERVAELLGKETIFDCKNGDSKWYNFEDMITEILINKEGVSCG